jgi:hypothetical protein
MRYISKDSLFKTFSSTLLVDNIRSSQLCCLAEAGSPKDLLRPPPPPSDAEAPREAAEAVEEGGGKSASMMASRAAEAAMARALCVRQRVEPKLDFGIEICI